MTFWIRNLRVGPFHLSLVRNDLTARLLQHRYGKRISRSFFHCEGYTAATLRAGWLFINLDVQR